MSNLYTKGFNEGYVLTEHLPDLAREISKIDSPLPWVEGFRDGREEYVIEKTKDLLPSWPESDLTKDNEPDKTQERDFDVER